MIAPTAAELLFVETSCSPTQLFRFPPSLRSNTGASPLFDYQHVEISVVVEVSNRHSASGKFLRENGAGLFANIPEATSCVLKHKSGSLYFTLRHAQSLPCRPGGRWRGSDQDRHRCRNQRTSGPIRSRVASPDRSPPVYPTKVRSFWF